VTTLQDFDGRRLQSVAQGAPDFGAADPAGQEAAEQAAAQCADLVARMKAILAGQAWDVRVTSRLTTSPACIVANEPDTDIGLVQRMRGSGMPSQPVLEINPQHPLVARLSRDPGDPHLAEWAHVLYSQAVLTLGARLDEPAGFVSRLNDLLEALAGGMESPGGG
jgi:molecular chaperone HtpG